MLMNLNMNNVERVFLNEKPSGVVFAPNYWQWFSHQRNHGTLPDEIKHCQTQLDLINYLGLDVFSRNIYCNQDEYWFGGICDESFDDVEVETSITFNDRDKITDKTYHCINGILIITIRSS